MVVVDETGRAQNRGVWPPAVRGQGDLLCHLLLAAPGLRVFGARHALVIARGYPGCTGTARTNPAPPVGRTRTAPRAVSHCVTVVLYIGSVRVVSFSVTGSVIHSVTHG